MLGSNGRVETKQQHDGSNSNGSGANMDLWQRLCQDFSNSYDNTVAERTWIVGSVRNSNGRGGMAEEVAF